MKNLKKAAVVLTAAALSSMMGMTAFAGQITTENGANSRDVYGTYQAGTGDTVYTVDVTWGGMLFTYKEGDGIWDPETHTYSRGAEESGWTSTNNTITVTNHSNAALEAVPKFGAKTAFSGVTASFSELNDNGALYLANAATDAYEDPDNAPSKTTEMSLTGDPGEFSGTTAIGVVEVRIRDAQ